MRKNNISVLLFVVVTILTCSSLYFLYADCCCDYEQMCCCGEEEGQYLSSYSCHCTQGHCFNECHFEPIEY